MKKEERMVKIEELRKGDILLLEPKESTKVTESKLICKLTKSPVSHATMSYYDCNTLIEENKPKVGTAAIREKATGRKAYVVRHRNTELNMDQVLKVAEDCLIKEIPYADINLYIFAVYFLITDAIEYFSLPLQKKLIRLFNLAMSEITKLAGEKIYGETHAMTCAQFVFYCYKKAGKKYQIHLDKHIGSGALIMKIKKYIEDNQLDWCNCQVETEDFDNTDFDSLLSDIQREIEHQNTDKKEQLEEKFVGFVCNFLKKLLIMMKIPEKDIEVMDFRTVIQTLVDNQEYLVVPGDLLENCTNIEYIGTLEI